MWKTEKQTICYRFGTTAVQMQFGPGRQWNSNPFLSVLNKNFAVQHTDVQNLKPRNNVTALPHSRRWGT
jgi:hypothetical protein